MEWIALQLPSSQPYEALKNFWHSNASLLHSREGGLGGF